MGWLESFKIVSSLCTGTYRLKLLKTVKCNV